MASIVQRIPDAVIKFEGGIAKGKAAVFKVDLSLDVGSVSTCRYLPHRVLGGNCLLQAGGEIKARCFSLFVCYFGV